MWTIVGCLVFLIVLDVDVLVLSFNSFLISFFSRFFCVSGVSPVLYSLRVHFGSCSDFFFFFFLCVSLPSFGSPFALPYFSFFFHSFFHFHFMFYCCLQGTSIVSLVVWFPALFSPSVYLRCWRMYDMLRLSYPVRWHGTAVSNLLITTASRHILSLCRRLWPHSFHFFSLGWRNRTDARCVGYSH